MAGTDKLYNVDKSVDNSSEWLTNVTDKLFGLGEKALDYNLAKTEKQAQEALADANAEKRALLEFEQKGYGYNQGQTDQTMQPIGGSQTTQTLAIVSGVAVLGIILIVAFKK